MPSLARRHRPRLLVAAAGLALLTPAAAHADVGAYRTAVLADGPIAYWKLDEASGATSAASAVLGGPVGNLSGDVTPGVSGAFNAPPNRALRLAAGTMEAEVPGTAQGVELWVRPSARTEQTLVRYGDPAAGGWSLGLSDARARGPLKRRLIFTTGGLTKNSKLTLAANTWTQVTASWASGTGVRFALNGGAVSRTVPLAQVPDTTTDPAELVVGPGAGPSGTVVDELALFPGTFDLAAHFAATGLPGLVAPPTLSPLTGVRAGDPLTFVAGTWAAGTATPIDTWQRCDSVDVCQTITPDPGATYRPSVADAGFTIQVREQATNATGTVVVYTDATDPVLLPDGTDPPVDPVLPPQPDPVAPGPDPVADPSPTAPGTTPGTTPGTVTPGTTPVTPLTTTPGSTPSSRRACSVRLRTWRGWRRRVRGVGPVRVAALPRSRTVVVRTRRGAVRRITWRVDRRKAHRRRARRAATTLRLGKVSRGRHRLSLRLTPRGHRRARTVRLRVRVVC